MGLPPRVSQLPALVGTAHGGSSDCRVPLLRGSPRALGAERIWCTGEDCIPTGDSPPSWRCSRNLVSPRSHPRQVGLVSRLLPAAALSDLEVLWGSEAIYLSAKCDPAASLSQSRAASARRAHILRPHLCLICAQEPDCVMLWVNNRNSRIIWITTVHVLSSDVFCVLPQLPWVAVFPSVNRCQLEGHRLGDEQWRRANHLGHRFQAEAASPDLPLIGSQARRHQPGG